MARHYTIIIFFWFISKDDSKAEVVALAALVGSSTCTFCHGQRLNTTYCSVY